MLTKRELLRSVALTTAAVAATKSFPVAAQTSAGRPGIIEAKDIAEAGFIYGLPIVKNYGVMYEYAVDRNSSQFKAPFNQITNWSRVATYKDTAVVTPNSDTPYSFLWVDLRAEPMVVSVPPVDPKRYYAVQLIDGNTFNYGYIGSRATGSDAGDWSSDRSGREQLPRESRRCSSRPRSFRSFSTAPSFSIRATSTT